MEDLVKLELEEGKLAFGQSNVMSMVAALTPEVNRGITLAQELDRMTVERDNILKPLDGAECAAKFDELQPAIESRWDEFKAIRNSVRIFLHQIEVFLKYIPVRPPVLLDIREEIRNLEIMKLMREKNSMTIPMKLVAEELPIIRHRLNEMMAEVNREWEESKLEISVKRGR